MRYEKTKCHGEWTRVVEMRELSLMYVEWCIHSVTLPYSVAEVDRGEQCAATEPAATESRAATVRPYHVVDLPIARSRTSRPPKAGVRQCGPSDALLVAFGCKLQTHDQCRVRCGALRRLLH